jgi:hypothetical protein
VQACAYLDADVPHRVPDGAGAPDARAGPSKAAKKPSPAVSTSPPVTWYAMPTPPARVKRVSGMSDT